MYKLIRKKGLKRLTLRLDKYAGYVIYAPKRCSKREIEAFWDQSQHLLPVSAHATQRQLRNQQYLRCKAQARQIITHKVADWARRMEVTYERIAIRDTVSRWGSCSAKKNLNFSYKVAFLPEELSTYIIIHELAHTVHLNHSVDFWNLVARFCPNYQQCQQALRTYSLRQNTFESNGYSKNTPIGEYDSGSSR